MAPSLQQEAQDRMVLRRNAENQRRKVIFCDCESKSVSSILSADGKAGILHHEVFCADHLSAATSSWKRGELQYV